MKATALLLARNMRTEYLDSPLGIDAPKPRFSCQLECESKHEARVNPRSYEVAVSEATYDKKFAPKDPNPKIQVKHIRSVDYATQNPSKSTWGDFAGGATKTTSEWIELVGHGRNDAQRRTGYRYCHLDWSTPYTDFLLPSDFTQAFVYVAGLRCYILYQLYLKTD